MANYSGGGHTAYIGKHLCLLTNAIFYTQHRYEQGELDYSLYLRRMHRLQTSFDHWLSKGTDVMVNRYRGRCNLLIKHRESLWVFLKKTLIPLTNNEAERCMRGFVIQRKISFGMTSDTGDKFRSRIHTLIETCKNKAYQQCLCGAISSLQSLRRNCTRTFLIFRAHPLIFNKSSYPSERLQRFAWVWKLCGIIVREYLLSAATMFSQNLFKHGCASE